MTSAAVGQSLRVLPESFVVERSDLGAASATAWLALVNAPEGLTVIRAAGPADSGEGVELWAGLYNGDIPHGLDVPGVLAALLTPLAAAGVPVFVASTVNGDVVLVPRARLDAAVAALAGAGCEVRR